MNASEQGKDKNVNLFFCLLLDCFVCTDFEDLDAKKLKVGSGCI